MTGYDDIYKLCCHQSNSTHAKFHPDLKLVCPDDETVRQDTVEYQTRPRKEQPREDETREPSPLPGEARVFPPSILAAILQSLLVFDDSLVHCISRLDPFCQPGQMPRNCNNQISLYHRFHVTKNDSGTQSISVTGATHPQNMLAPLLVSKDWLFVGCHLFYGLNKFAFSSLGE